MRVQNSLKRNPPRWTLPAQGGPEGKVHTLTKNQFFDSPLSSRKVVPHPSSMIHKNRLHFWQHLKLPESGPPPQRFLEIRRSAGFWGQNTKSSTNIFLIVEMEKWVFMKSCLIYCKIHLNMSILDAILMTRESICGLRSKNMGKPFQPPAPSNTSALS